MDLSVSGLLEDAKACYTTRKSSTRTKVDWHERHWYTALALLALLAQLYCCTGVTGSSHKSQVVTRDTTKIQNQKNSLRLVELILLDCTYDSEGTNVVLTGYNSQRHIHTS